MYKLIAPAALAAALVAAVATPTAASAATTPPPVPEIGAVFSNGDHTTVHDGAAEMTTAQRMGLGSLVGETRFSDARVVVQDEKGREVCTTASNDWVSDGGWECYATPATLGVGVHVVHAVAYDTDGDASEASAPVRLTVTGDQGTGGTDAVPSDGAVDPGFTAPGATAQPGPGVVDAGFTPQHGVAAPTTTVTTSGASTVIGITSEAFLTVEVRRADGEVVSSEVTTGYRSVVVPTPAAGTTEQYTVVTRDDERRESAPVTVDVTGVAAEDDATAQPAPGPVDPGFTAPEPEQGEQDATAQPAPGPVDQGFTAPEADAAGQFEAPSAVWASIRFVNGEQHVIASLATRTGAKVIVTESNGTEHEYTADASGLVRVDFVWPGGSAPTFTAVAHHGGQVSAVATITPTRG